MHPVERRRSRSSRPVEALSFFLNRARHALGVRALTLGTTAGHLIAGSGEDLERVAEAGADVDAGKTIAERIATWRLRLGNSDVVLTSLGGAFDPELGAGVRRILAG
jgi:hypothetical protein